MIKSKTSVWLTLVTLAAFAVCAVLAVWGGLNSTEIALHTLVSGQKGVFYSAMWILSFVGDTLRVLVVCAVLLMIPKFNVRYGIPAVLSVTAACIINNIIKIIFRRPRPDAEYGVLTDTKGYSFPSGHAMDNSALYFALAVCVILLMESGALKKLLVALLVIFPLLMSFSRIYFGAHYTTDIVAGIALGMLCAYWVPVWYHEKVYPKMTAKVVKAKGDN